VEKPGSIALISAIVLVNLIADWLWFKPTNLLSFVVVEALVLGAIIALASWASRAQ